jgi:hypothetical protein
MSIEKAKQELDDAVTNVAQAAQMLADGNQELTKADDDTYSYLVHEDDMAELKEALKVWKEKTQNFLSEVVKAGD